MELEKMIVIQTTLVVDIRNVGTICVNDNNCSMQV